MYIFSSDSNYPKNNKPVNEVIIELQKRYGFLDKYDMYVSSRILDFNFDEINDEVKLNDILTMLFKEYLENNIMEVYTANNLIDTGLLYLTTRVTYVK